ncbi:hypothetical protein KUCAC02_002300, partial [Chaenocephalus aceratus]
KSQELFGTDLRCQILPNNYHTFARKEPLESKVLLVWNFQTSTKPQLNNILRDFYATVRNGKGELYGLSSYIGLRAGLNRHINYPPLGLSWSLLKDTEFTTCNNVFIGVVKMLRKKGLDTSVHHSSITEDDFKAIKQVLDPKTPEGLKTSELRCRQCL